MIATPTRVVVAEDEPLAREALAELVADSEGFELVGAFADGASALAGIDDLLPDVVFLDIRMPALSGLQVVERMKSRPLVVFTTAYDSHAISAFELGAIDYILKPFDETRFAQARDRIQNRIATVGPGDPELLERLQLLINEPERPRRIFARDSHAIIPLQTDEITHVSADGDYSNVHVDGRAYLVGAAIGSMGALLGQARFLRVHRAHLVNVEKIESIVTFDERRLEVRLVGGTRIVASRAGSKRLRDLVL